MNKYGLVGIAMVALLGCGGGEKKVGNVEQPGGGPAPKAEPPQTGPDSWAGWQSWQKVSTEKWPSKTHGGRFVEVYVNDVGLEAYMAGEETEMPVGSIVIKPSWEDEGGQAGAEGPVFIMEKKAAGFAPDSGDWFYAFQWDDPTGEWKQKLGGPVKWQSPSDKVTYCVDCHDSYDRQLGGVPQDKRAW
jgi:hypothetical protein